MPGKLQILCVVVILLVGTGLRAAAVRWNDGVLHGDVTLFALSARELAERGALAYPYRSNFHDGVAYTALDEPASLHAPLPAAAAAWSSRVVGVDAYRALQGLSLATGLGLLLAMVVAASRATSSAAWVAAAGVCLSPTLVDFSGNGSPYVGIALCLAGLTACATRTPTSRGAWIALGVLAGLSFELHASQFGVVLGVGVLAARRGRGALLAFAATVLVLHLPATLWRWRNDLGLLETGGAAAWLWRMGLLQPEVTAEGTVRMARTPWSAFEAVYFAKQAALQSAHLAGALALAVGPLTWPLLLVGLRELRGRWGALVPALAYLVVLAVWARFDHRQVVPLLPLLWMLAGLGCARLLRRGARHTAAALLVVALGGQVAGLVREPGPRYFGSAEAAYLERYVELLALGEILEQEAPTVVLALGPGVELLWRHPVPMVRIGWDDGPLTAKVARDFGASHAIVPARRVVDALALWPEAEVLVEEGPICLLRL